MIALKSKVNTIVQKKIKENENLDFDQISEINKNKELIENLKK